MTRARRLVREAERIVALTGAGVSAESGVPTFRGEGGLWRNHRPEDLATVDALDRDAETVWAWYRWRRGLLASCEPNPGHRALARLFLERGRPGLITQNVDGLHARAALDEAKGASPEPALPVELHGALARDRCNRCGSRFDARAPEHPSPDAELPRCPTCKGLLRPDVVLFGEPLDQAVLTRARRLARRADVCLVVGTSAAVHPAAAIPLETLRAGGRVVEVNVEATELSPVASVAVRGPAAEALPELLDLG